MPPAILSERRRRLRQAFEQAVQFACEQRAHLFLIAGDLFDNPNPRNVERAYVADALRRLRDHRVTVVAIGGNHDTPKGSTEQGGYVPQSVYQQLGALVFFDQNPTVRPWRSRFGDVKVAVGGITPRPNLLPEHNPLEGITFEGTDADVRILLLHHPVEGTIHPDAQEAILTRSAIAALSDVDYLFTGGIHRYHTFVIGNKRVVVPGATERLDFGGPEDGQVGFVYLEIEPGSVDRQPQFCPIMPQPRAELLIRATELQDGDPMHTILNRLEDASGADTLLKLRIEGAIPLETFSRLDTRRIEAVGRAHNFFFDLDMSGLRVYRPSESLSPAGPRRSMREEIAAYVDDLIQAAHSEEERSLLTATKQALLAEYDALTEGQ
jgi:DNA repair exonuclease SbcCD nuclease subunit